MDYDKKYSIIRDARGYYIAIQEDQEIPETSELVHELLEPSEALDKLIELIRTKK
jgi:hypothetical protein